MVLRWATKSLDQVSILANTCGSRNIIMSSALNGYLWMLPLSELTLFTMLIMIVDTSMLARQIVFTWNYFLINAIFLSLQNCPSWTGVVIAISMAASWLLAVALVRIPITRRLCLDNARDLSHLCLTFCVLWVAAMWFYNKEPIETLSGKFAAATSEMPTNIMHAMHRCSEGICHIRLWYIGLGSGVYGHVEFLGEFEVEASDCDGWVAALGHAGKCVPSSHPQRW